jgi:hypothetical protein
MKRKRLFAIAIAIALITVLLASSVALAAKPQNFEANGVCYIAGEYVSWLTGPVEHAVNEPVNCDQLTVSGWNEADGSVFESLHAGLIVFHSNGICQGSLHGTFVLTNDGSRLKGIMRGKVVYDPVSDTIHDYGTFTSTGGTGIFTGNKVRGTWEAFLCWNDSVGTYVGQIFIEGTFQ